MWNKARLFGVVGAAVVLAAVFVHADTSLDGERLELEIKMQQRVEEALGRILPPGQFVVVVRVEPLAQLGVDNLPGGQPAGDGYYLPGVPVRKNLDNTGEEVKALADSLKPDPKFFHRFIRRILVTLVLDKDLPEDTANRVRDLTQQIVSLDPARGDTLTVQRTTFNKVTTDSDSIASTPIQKIQREVRSYWFLISLALAIFCILIFILFIFGPLRGFLNNFLQVLPTLKPMDANGRGRLGAPEPAYLPSYMPQPMGLPMSGGGSSPANFSGSLQVENPNKAVMPFGFVREDHLGNLAILLSRESPEKAAVVLGYLPPEWISRILARLEAGMQSEIASHLATTRQLLPEQVEDIEQDLKRRLDYLVGGPERIYAVYESLEPEAQRRMLESLRETRPEIAEEMRQRTMAFEDLERLPSPALKSLLREVDLQTLVTSLKGVSASFRSRVFEHMPAGKAEIVRQELELSDDAVGKSTHDAQRKIVLIAKRLERDGQIHFPQIDESVPTTRYGTSLRSTLKLPPGLKIDDTLPTATPSATEETGGKEDIRDRIRRFMDRRSPDKERFPPDVGSGKGD